MTAPSILASLPPSLNKAAFLGHFHGLIVLPIATQIFRSERGITDCQSSEGTALALSLVKKKKS